MQVSLRIKAAVTSKSVFRVLTHPLYGLAAIVSGLVIAGIIIWSLNIDLIISILFGSSLNIIEKIRFFSYGYQSLFSDIGNIHSLGIIVFSLLFGTNISMLLFVILRQGLASVPKKSGGSALLFAILSGGCVACGTSLLAPLFITLGVTSTAALRDIGTILVSVGSILIVYSIYRLALLVATIFAQSK